MDAPRRRQWMLGRRFNVWFNDRFERLPELAHELVALGAFRADVSGAGPTVYGLFTTGAEAESAAGRLAALGRTFVARPVPAAGHA